MKVRNRIGQDKQKKKIDNTKGQKGEEKIMKKQTKKVWQVEEIWKE